VQWHKIRTTFLLVLNRGGCCLFSLLLLLLLLALPLPAVAGSYHYCCRMLGAASAGCSYSWAQVCQWFLKAGVPALLSRSE
jgi:hypothetical protein